MDKSELRMLQSKVLLTHCRDSLAICRLQFVYYANEILNAKEIPF